MGILEQLSARSVQDASRSALVLVAAATAVTTVWLIINPPESTVVLLACLALPAALLVLCLGTLRLPVLWARLALGLPTVAAAVAVIVALDIATDDSSVGAQVLLCFPVLYASAHLPPRAAAVATGVAVLGDAVVCFTLQTPEQAATDVGYVATILVTMSVLLVRAGQRQERLVEQLVRQAAVDPLTGLVTRRVLDQAVERALRGTSGLVGTGLVLVDIDHFKTVNDTYGHPVGDDALRHIATLLSAHARSDAVVSRMGGDELALLLPGCSPDVAERRAHGVVAAVAASPLTLADGAVLPLSVSVGVAHAPRHALDVRGLYAAADAALYGAKRAGRGRVGLPVEPVVIPSQAAPSQGSGRVSAPVGPPVSLHGTS